MPSGAPVLNPAGASGAEPRTKEESLLLSDGFSPATGASASTGKGGGPASGLVVLPGASGLELRRPARSGPPPHPKAARDDDARPRRASDWGEARSDDTSLAPELGEGGARAVFSHRGLVSERRSEVARDILRSARTTRPPIWCQV